MSGSEGETRDEVARQVGLGSGRTYERAKATIAKAERLAPEVAVKAKAGELTMREVAKEVRAAEKAQKVAEIRSRVICDYTGPGNEWSGRWLHSPGPGHRLTRSR